MTYKRFISCSGKIKIHEYSFLGQKRQQTVHEMNMNPIPTSKVDSQYGELAATIQPLTDTIIRQNAVIATIQQEL